MQGDTASPPLLGTRPVPVAMTADQARVLTDEIKNSVQRTWALLLIAYEEKAWVALGYPSWREYATTELDLSQSHAYRLLDAAQVVREIETAAGSPVGEISERDARAIKPHLDEVLQAVREQTEAAEPGDVPALVADVIASTRADEDGPGAGQEQVVPAAPARRRRPLPDAYRAAVYDLGRVVARLERLHDDDRFPRLHDDLRTRHQGDLGRAAGLAVEVLGRLRAKA